MSKPETSRMGLLSSAAYAGMFVFGIVMALLGAILPSVSERLRFGAPDIGTLFLVMNGAMLAASLVLGLAMDRFGMKPPLALGPMLVAISLVMVVRAGAFQSLLPAVALLGIGGGALNGATNTLVADLHTDLRRKTAALNLLGVFFGFGALFLPFTVGALLARFGIGNLLIAAAVLCGVAGAFTALLHFPAPKQRNALPIGDVPRFLRSPLVVALAALLFFESGVEFTLGGFISTYLTRDVAMNSLALASWVLAGYWAAIMASRAVLSRMELRASPYRRLQFCAAGACLGALLTAVAPPGTSRAPLTACAVILCGWSLAGIYPAALGIAGARFESHSGTVFGVLFGVALAGGMILPWAAGQVGGAAGLRWVFAIVAGSFVAILGLSGIAARIDRDKQEPRG